MAQDDKGPLAKEVRRLMDSVPIKQKHLAERAGVNPTYIRDILKGKSKNPITGKLRSVIDAFESLGVDARHLFGLAAAPETAEMVSDPSELFLLHTWRKLPEEERKDIREFIVYRMARASAAVGKSE